MAYDAIVVLPYTRVRRRCGQVRMSHFTARCILAGLELYVQGAAERFVLPGEQRAPATSDLERQFLESRGVPAGNIADYPNLNGTLQQLEPVANLQRYGELSSVVVVCFAFHALRVLEYMRMLPVHGDLAEVERTHAAYLRDSAGARRVNREELLSLPQLAELNRAELGISHLVLRLDRPFGRRAPLTRLLKLLAGPTITDIDHGRAHVGLERLDRLLHAPSAKGL
jgi:hypothetical protein